MTHEFPEIRDYGSALRFALQAEQACATAAELRALLDVTA